MRNTEFRPRLLGFAYEATVGRPVGSAPRVICLPHNVNSITCRDRVLKSNIIYIALESLGVHPPSAGNE